MRPDQYVLTDLTPRVLMCPLPKGFWWEVELSPRNDAAFVRLWKRRNISHLASGCVIDVSAKSTDELVSQVIDRSYEVWQKFVRTAHNKNDEWQRRAAELQERLAHPTTKIKVKVDTIR